MFVLLIFNAELEPLVKILCPEPDFSPTSHVFPVSVQS